jgi:hypothetical protein
MAMHEYRRDGQSVTASGSGIEGTQGGQGVPRSGEQSQKRSGRSFAAYSTSSSDPAAMTDAAEQRVDAAAVGELSTPSASKSLLTELLHARK